MESLVHFFFFMFGLFELRNLRSLRSNSFPLIWSLSFSDNSYFSFITKIKSIETLRHWLSLRVSAIILIPTLLFLLFVFIFIVHVYHFDVFNLVSLSIIFSFIWFHQFIIIKFFLITVFVILLIHLVKGNEDVMYDYIHNEKTRLFSFFLLTCVQIQLFKYLYIFIIF